MRRLLPLLLLVTSAACFGQAVPPAPDDNTRLTALFDADQHDRMPPPGKAIDWSKVGPADEVRRSNVRTMLDTGAVRTGTDYYHAAFVFQHGQTSNDFLLAHALAVTAMAKGHADAGWIAAATLDRYLQKLDRPQIYGTQYLMQLGHSVTQEPYDRTLISDAQRRAISIPVLAEQEARRRERDAEHSRTSPGK